MENGSSLADSLVSYFLFGGENECRQTNLNTTVIEREEMPLPQQDRAIYLTVFVTGIICGYRSVVVVFTYPM